MYTKKAIPIIGKIYFTPIGNMWEFKQYEIYARNNIYSSLFYEVVEKQLEINLA